ncbi:o-succinylbenzoate synthase [bacterium]|nr:o-succinylbenzoate synthase [bacterium]
MIYREYQYRFAQPVGTSRGVLTDRPVFVVEEVAENGGRIWAELAPLPGLSLETRAPDWLSEYRNVLDWVCRLGLEAAMEEIDRYRAEFPSVAMGLESLEAQKISGSPGKLYDSDYARGQAGIAINGLVWMGTPEEEGQRARALVERGFGCLKFKIGADYFERAMPMLRSVRAQFPGVEVRVDANGAFELQKAIEVVHDLAALGGVHSIEQPLPVAASEADWKRLIRTSPIPIALDESLIGRNPELSADWLRALKPTFLVLKPSLLGGFERCERWMNLADLLGVGYWCTSMLEGPLGLDAIAQFAAAKVLPRQGNVGLQGLGTGSIFRLNEMPEFDFAHRIEAGSLWRIARSAN